MTQGVPLHVAVACADRLEQDLLRLTADEGHPLLAEIFRILRGYMASLEHSAELIDTLRATMREPLEAPVGTTVGPLCDSCGKNVALVRESYTAECGPAEFFVCATCIGGGR